MIPNEIDDDFRSTKIFPYNMKITFSYIIKIPDANGSTKIGIFLIYENLFLHIIAYLDVLFKTFINLSTDL